MRCVIYRVTDNLGVYICVPGSVASVKLEFFFLIPWSLILYISRSDRRWIQHNLTVSSFCVLQEGETDSWMF